MFEAISKRFDDIRRRFFAPGKITEKNVQEGIQEVHKALLEADVNNNVAKAFIERVKAQAVGEHLFKSVSPAELFVKIVSDELTALMGPVDHTIKTAQGRPTVIMMAGLQGSGKTTTCGKLAKYLMAKGFKPLLVAADIQRPAAIEQLITLGQALNVPVFSQPKLTPPKICSQAISHAAENGRNLVILDTAGRLHIDEDLMRELEEIKKQTKPDNIFLVMDAMTGQDAVNSSKEFNERIGLDGVIMTKLDGDARGGAALSVKEVTGKPIKFIGV
jgi:signal recognition particle subunit SRP54